MFKPSLQKFISFNRRFQSQWSYWHQIGKSPLKPQTIGNLLGETSRKFPEQTAIISRHDNRTVSYVQLFQAADKFAVALLKFGLQKGDRVGIWSSNSIEWETVMMACHRLGLVVVELNPAYKAEEMKYCINKVGVKCLVCPEKVGRQDYYGILGEIDGSLGKSEPGRLKLRNVPTLETVVVISNNNLKGVYNYEEVFHKATEEEAAKIPKLQDDIQFDEGSNIMFTSGSTGNPKAALLSHFNLINNSLSLSTRLKMSTTSKVLVQVPYFHTFGTTAAILGSMHYGSTQVLPSQTYNPEKNLEALSSEQCNMVYGTPTMHIDLIAQQREKNLPVNIDYTCSGGSLISNSLIQQIYDVFKVKQFIHFCGSTETTAMTYHSHVTDSKEVLFNSVGQITDHVEVKVVDEKGKIVPLGVPGECCVRGYSVMLGYDGDEDKTSEIYKDDKWLHTGDKMAMLENGYMKFVGRLKDLIIRGGENIYPKEVEDVLSQHDSILECQVVGIPHERLGEEVCACVRLKPNVTLTQKKMQEFCDNKMAHFKIPSKLYVMEEFPKTTSGKIQKFKIVQQILKMK